MKINFKGSTHTLSVPVDKLAVVVDSAVVVAVLVAVLAAEWWVVRADVALVVPYRGRWEAALRRAEMTWECRRAGMARVCSVAAVRYP